MDFNAMAKQLPQRPGVYKMFDSLGNIIYVGKAKNLKNRVSQYFRAQKDRAPKVAEMIQNIHGFNYQVTDTELDAFIEECRLIKEIKPRYNKQLKNSNYLYFKIPKELYPKVMIVKETTADGAIYFGPFTSRHRVESALQYFNELYPLRKCTTPGFVTRANGCLYGQLGTCLGVCTGRISPDAYGSCIEKIQQILTGNDTSVLPKLAQRVSAAVEELKFELAAQYQEYYLGLRHVIGKQRLVQISNKNRNILALEFLAAKVVKLFCIKGNRLVFSEVVNISVQDKLDLEQHFKQVICTKFAADKSGMGILSQRDLDEAQIIYSYLQKNKARILSYWIPSSRLKGEAMRLDTTVAEIVNRITAGSAAREQGAFKNHAEA